MNKHKAGFLVGSRDGTNWKVFNAIFTEEIRQRIGELYDLHPDIVQVDELSTHAKIVGTWEVVFCTWGFPRLNATQLSSLPGLSHVFYAGGSIKSFAPVLLENGIGVSSARDINSAIVADYCETLIYLSLKGFFETLRGYSSDCLIRKNFLTAKSFSGVERGPVALIGFGAIGRKLASKLVQRRIEVLVVDPFLELHDAVDFGVRAVSLETALGCARVVSNHLPDLDSLSDYFSQQQFRAMQAGSTFINTGRGRQVDEIALADVFAERADLTAILDVTVQDPLPLDNPLRKLPNVVLTPHIAGCVGKDLELLGASLIEQASRYEREGYPDVELFAENWAVMA